MAAAVSVLLGGIVVALLFRHKSPQTHPATPQPGARRLVLRKHAEPPVAGHNVPLNSRKSLGFPYTVVTPGQQAAERVTVVRPTNSHEPPPLPKSYPQSVIPGTSRWGPSIGMPLPRPPRHVGPLGVGTADGPVRTHKIVDGDSLEALARRYLGNADRYLEIYEANRILLTSPQLLPIGAELKIPPRHGSAVSESDQVNERPLVPIVH